MTAAGTPPTIVDANVAIKWFLEEELSDRARALLADHLGTTLLAPPHFTGEVVNGLYRRVHRSTNPITATQSRQAVSDFLALSIETIEPANLYQQAYGLAERHAIATIYDCLYVVTAQRIGGAFWTADQNLINALGGAGRQVRFLGTYPRQQR